MRRMHRHLLLNSMKIYGWQTNVPTSRKQGPHLNGRKGSLPKNG